MYGWHNAQSLVGLALTMGLCWAVSEDRRRFPLRLAVGALGVQLGLVLLLFGFAPAQGLLQGVGAGVDALAGSTQAGTQFVFGYLAGGDQPFPVNNAQPLYLLGFRVLPVILVICALAALLWHWGVLRVITRAFGFVFQKTLGLRGAPALGTAATIFLGQVEGPMFVRAYLGALTRSELFTLMTVGLSCVSGSTMVAYATLSEGHAAPRRRPRAHRLADLGARPASCSPASWSRRSPATRPSPATTGPIAATTAPPTP